LFFNKEKDANKVKTRGEFEMTNTRKLFCLVVLVAVWGGSTLAANVILAWNPSPGPTVAGYDIYYWVAKSVRTNEIAAGPATSVTISNLQAGTTYDFAAASVSLLGLQSRLSAVIAYTVPNSATAAAYPNNHPPTLNAIGSLAVHENAGWQAVNLSGITSGAAGERSRLTVTAVSSNPGLIRNPEVIYSSPRQTGTLIFMPVAKAVGITTITVTVNDGAATSNIVTRTFTVLVVPGSPPPTGPPPWGIGGTTEAAAAALMPATVAADTMSAASRADVVVANPAASLAVAAPVAGHFSINVTGMTGQPYAVQASTDLVNWAALQTNTAPFTFTDSGAGQFSERFYRAVYAP
jgi:hypothetical protein